VIVSLFYIKVCRLHSNNVHTFNHQGHHFLLFILDIRDNGTLFIHVHVMFVLKDKKMVIITYHNTFQNILINK
jgi:hypothetical protein